MRSSVRCPAWRNHTQPRHGMQNPLEHDERSRPGSSSRTPVISARHAVSATARCASSPDRRYVVLDTEAVFHVDATAAEILARLTADLREHHCELVLARPRETVLATLHASPYEEGATRRLRMFPSVREAYAALRSP